MKVILISQIFCVCFCWFSGIFTHASFIKGDYCLEKFHTVQIPFFHLPFLVVSILIEVSCVFITVAASILHIYVAEYGNRIIITILEMTVYSFLTESQNFTNVSSLNFRLSILSAFFMGFQRKWLSMNTERPMNPLTLLSKYSKKLLVRGIQIHAVLLGDWLQVCSVFTFRIKQSCETTHPPTRLHIPQQLAHNNLTLTLWTNCTSNSMRTK